MHYPHPFYLVLFCLASLPAGILVGCLVCAQMSFRNRRGAPAGQPSTSDAANVAPAIRMFQHAESAFRSFCAVTDGLQRDVGQHGDRIAAAATLLVGLSPQDVERAVMRIIEANGWLQDQLVTAQATIRKQSIELAQRMVEANTDGLTGICNRRAFDMELERQLARWHRYGAKFALMLFDIDRFKVVNDQQGHAAGDAVLRATAEIIRTNLREVDFAARFGGEEFAVILPETDQHNALVAADRIRKAVGAARIPWEGKELSVTISVGIAGLSHLDDAAALLKRADEALYISKSAGRNRTTLSSYTPRPEDGQAALVDGANRSAT